jgi:hypothetical protein
MVCPMCNVGGFICKTKVVDLGIDLFTCGKCSACWSKNQKDSPTIFRSLSAFLNEHGLQYGDAEIEEIRLICQMCNNQGEIYKVKVINLGIELKVCNKCEACWTQDQMITIETLKNLPIFLKEHSFQRRDIEIEGPIILCPRCDGQGEIYKAKLAGTGIELEICEECEACWSKNQRISTKTFKNLSTFLEEHGLQYSKTKIERL